MFHWILSLTVISCSPLQVPVLEPVAIYSAIMEATKIPTVSLILPMTAWLIVRELDPVNSVFIGGTEVAHADLTAAVRQGRENMHADYAERYFVNLPIGELEDLCVATILDPRFKNFDFEGAVKYDEGKLTRDR